mmetsp:Transcript_84311/g.217115  ORF Transcript_84311/g.217115 Transcript_84311/m.217115 type:complete len:255 (+) Transcript_84311:3081-3845(+)
MRAWQHAMNVCGSSNMFTPQTTASSMRPRLTVTAAVSAATSDEEQAVSMVQLGPFRPNAYEMRFDEIDAEPPVAAKGPAWAADCMRFQSHLSCPTKTPASLPMSSFRGSRASTKADNAISSKWRCCGSIASASPLLMLKLAASKSSAPSVKPPWRTYISSPVGASGWKYSSMSQRAKGTSTILSVPALSMLDRAGSEWLSPGKLQPVPDTASCMLADGLLPAGAAARATAAGMEPASTGTSWPEMYPEIAFSVG